MVSLPVVTAPSSIPSISNHSDDNLMEIYENCNLKKWCYSFCLSHSWDALTWFKLLTWFTLLPWFNQWDLPCDNYRKVQTGCDTQESAAFITRVWDESWQPVEDQPLPQCRPREEARKWRQKLSRGKNMNNKREAPRGKRGFLPVFKKSGGVAQGFGE